MLDRPLSLGMMARAGRELAVVHGPQLAAERLAGHADPELVPDPLAQVDQPPADHAVDGRHGPALDHGGQRRALRVVEPRRLARRLAVEQAIRAVRVEPHDPVPDDLQRHAADRRGLGARGALADRGQRQQAARLAIVLARACRTAQARRVEVRPQRDRHGAFLSCRQP